MSKRAISGIIVLIIVTAVIAGFIYTRKHAANSTAHTMPPTVVEISPVKQESWHNILQATGTLVATRGVLIKAEAAGQVTQFFVKPGQHVDAGQVLVQLNPNVIKAQLDYNLAQLKLSQTNYNRVKALYNKHAFSKSEFDKAQATLKSNQAKVNESRALLSQLLIRAPFSGTLGLIKISLGEYLAVGSPIVNLQTVDPMLVNFSIPQNHLRDLKVGQTIIIKSRSYPNQQFKGKITAFDSLISSDTRSLNVQANLPNKSGVLLPGTFVEVTLLVGKAHNTLVIPLTSLVYSEDGNFVYRVVDHKAKKTPVVLGEQRGDNIAIKTGLAPKETIVTAGQMKLYDGATVITQREAHDHH